jgi:hypothetical protein
MIKTFTTFIFIFFVSFQLFSQGNPQTISLGATYANQVWFNLETSAQNESAKDNWDISFELSGFGYAMHINPSKGIKLWLVPGTDTSIFNAVDTTGMANTWTSLTNTDTSWAWGAFNMSADLSNEFDLGWGEYNLITHNIMAKRIFILKLSDGSYRKFMVNSLIASKYKITYSKLDGSGEVIALINKSDFTGKNFVYYTFMGDSIVDREPLTSDWNLTFTQYTGYVPTPYLVTGVLLNKDVEAVKVYPVDDPVNFSDYVSQIFSAEINTIGYNWKSFSGGSFVIADSTVYFVKTQNQDIWKVIFTSFEGSTTGSMGFTTEKVFANTISNGIEQIEFEIYPNPTGKGTVTIASNGKFDKIEILDLSGKTVFSSKTVVNPLFQIDTQTIPAGIYILKGSNNQQVISRKLIIQ